MSYVFDEEIVEPQKAFWKYDVYYEKDVAGIGSDLMSYQKMWNKFPKDDIYYVTLIFTCTIKIGLKS